MKRLVFLSITRKGQQTKLVNALPVPQSQQDIDQRDKRKPAEREITRRFELIGVK